MLIKEKFKTVIETHDARDYPYREDLADSFLPYLAYRFRSDRIEKKYRETIHDAMPNRIAFFDTLGCKMVGGDDSATEGSR